MTTDQLTETFAALANPTRRAMLDRLAQGDATVAEPEPGDTAGERGLELTRIFDAPRERLWREWTEPERFADWFGGREAHIPVDSVSMDVRPGGRWQATMHHDGVESQWEGV